MILQSSGEESLVAGTADLGKTFSWAQLATYSSFAHNIWVEIAPSAH